MGDLITFIDKKSLGRIFRWELLGSEGCVGSCLCGVFTVSVLYWATKLRPAQGNQYRHGVLADTARKSESAKIMREPQQGELPESAV